MTKRLFDPIVETGKLHPSFEKVRNSPPGHPGRAMMEDLFADFSDVDGNFLEQFQTTGFDTRCFELYVYAVLSREGFSLDRSKPNPDFLVEKGGTHAAIEVTTVNPSTRGAMATPPPNLESMSFADRVQYEQNELAIRFGSPLFSKLQKRYWELDHCKDKPLILFVQAFHSADALVFSDSALTSYLFGLKQSGSWSQDGELTVSTASVEKHAVPDKSIPSNFFQLPDAEHVSAVVFSNSGSLAKFDRMGFQHGYGVATFNLTRFGTSFNPDPDAMDPTAFLYDVGQPPLIETWSQGLVVNHNPNARFPLPDGFFGPVVDSRLKGGRLVSDLKGWHPINSKTHVLHLGDAKSKIPEPLLLRPSVAVHAINKREFEAIFGFTDDGHPLIETQGWFADMTESFLGTVIYDKQDKDWGFVVLARDPRFKFRAIKTESSIKSRRDAAQALQQEMLMLVLKPQRIFAQD